MSIYGIAGHSDKSWLLHRPKVLCWSEAFQWGSQTSLVALGRTSAGTNYGENTNFIVRPCRTLGSERVGWRLEVKWTLAQESGCAQRCSQGTMHTEPTVPQCAPGRANRLKWDTHHPTPSFVKANVTFPYHRPTTQQTLLGRGGKKKKRVFQLWEFMQL